MPEHEKALMLNAVNRLLLRVPDWGPRLSRFYLLYWNPLNYAVVGGLGVLINFGIWQFCLILGLPWFLNNLIAILCAWVWNWSNSVGPFGYLWGFNKRKDTN